MTEKHMHTAIATALLQDRNGLIALLKKNGVIISSNYTDREIIIAVLEALRKSPRFKSDLAAFLTNMASAKSSFTGEGMFHGFTGESMFRLDGVHPPNGWYGADGRAPAPTAWKAFDGSAEEMKSQGLGGAGTVAGSSPGSTTTPKKDSLLSGVLNSTTISNIFNTGLDVLSTSLINKSNQKLADTAKQIEEEKTKQAALLAAGAGGSGAAATPGLSTGAKIGIIAGVVVLVSVGLYFLLRHRRRTRAAKAAK